MTGILGRNYQENTIKGVPDLLLWYLGSSLFVLWYYGSCSKPLRCLYRFNFQQTWNLFSFLCLFGLAENAISVKFHIKLFMLALSEYISVVLTESSFCFFPRFHFF